MSDAALPDFPAGTTASATKKMSKRMMKAYNLQGFSGTDRLPPPTSPIITLESTNDTFASKKLEMIEPIKIGRQTTPKQPPTGDNGVFDSKVLSRQHAEVYFENGKVLVKDAGSSNGTFVNGERLSPEGIPSQPKELVSGDLLEFGVDIMTDDGSAVLYRKVSARVAIDFGGVGEPVLSPVTANVGAGVTIEKSSTLHDTQKPSADTIRMLQEQTVNAQKLSEQLAEVEKLIDLKTVPFVDKSDELKATIAELTSHVSELEKQVTVKDEKLTELSQQLDSAKNTHAAEIVKQKSDAAYKEKGLSGQIGNLKESISAYEKEVATLRQQLEGSRESLQDLEATKVFVTELKSQMQQMKTRHDAELEVLKQDQTAMISLKASEFDALSSKYSIAQQELESARNNVESSKQDYEQKLKTAQDENIRMKEQLDAVFEELEERRKHDSTVNEETMTIAAAVTQTSTNTETVNRKENETQATSAEKTTQDVKPSNGATVSVTSAILLAIVSMVISFLAAQQFPK